MARNGSGVRKATESSIEIEFTYRGIRCRERIKCKPTDANIRRVTLFRDVIIDEIEAGTFDYAAKFPDSKKATSFQEVQDRILMGTWLDKWLDRKESHVKASTYDGIRKTVSILKKAWGHRFIDDIKKRDVREWCETLNIRNHRIKKFLFPLRDSLQCAVDDELIEVNPLHDFKFKRIEQTKDDHVDPLSREEAEKLLSVISGQYKNMIQFALWTGLRSSELIALEWGDVDFIRGIVMIQRAKTQAAKTTESTKTRAGTREIKLLAPALAALGSQKQFTFLAGKHIFLNQITGKPYDGDQQLRQAWQRALLKSGIRYRIPYQTRHTFASWMLSAGESLPWIATQMGHSNVMVTARHYARFIADSQPDAGNKAVELFSNK